MALLIYNIFSQHSSGVEINRVPCIDPSKPLIQNYSFHLSIIIQGKIKPLNPSLGHDPAQCLREIYTNNSSGQVFVHSVSSKPYVLADFFSVSKNFTEGYHPVSITIDGNPVVVFSSAPLTPNKNIVINFD